MLNMDEGINKNIYMQALFDYCIVYKKNNKYINPDKLLDNR